MMADERQPRTELHGAAGAHVGVRQPDLYGPVSPPLAMNADDQAWITQAMSQAVINVYGPWCDHPDLPGSERSRAVGRVRRARRELAAIEDTRPIPVITLTGVPPIL